MIAYIKLHTTCKLAKLLQKALGLISKFKRRSQVAQTRSDTCPQLSVLQSFYSLLLKMSLSQRHFIFKSIFHNCSNSNFRRVLLPLSNFIVSRIHF